ncbi:hypothetical protein FOVSG1_003044 [Fusarium oxysporum f. sp. vasinfectum]
MWKTSSKDTSIEIVALLDDKDDATSTHIQHTTPRHHRFARRKMSLEKWGQLSALIGRDMNMVAYDSAMSEKTWSGKGYDWQPVGAVI